MKKSNVVKSKSSNSAITTRSDNPSSNKKSRSSAEFQRQVLKKRGVYVEKKDTNPDLHSAGNLQDKNAVAPKPPPRPRPGQKRFLASVLTILSKSTAGTQFPEKGVKSTKKKSKRKADADNPNLDIKAKPKYRSKVLNDEMFKNLDQQKSLVLQYKNINNSPSNYSESSYRTHELAKSGNYMRSDIGSIMSSEAKGVVKQVLEGLQIKNKDVRIQEPVTQVEKTSKGKDGENDEQLYKFFVDLLETTFSVYNVKPEYDAAYDAAPVGSAGSSRIAFEIDESVVKKLGPRKSFGDDVTTQPSNFYCVKDTDISGGRNARPELCGRSKEIPFKQARPKPKRRMKAHSFIYSTIPTKKPIDTSTALLYPKKSFSKKAKKKTLINLFKEQLNRSYSDYQEPQTLYEALKVMARNKRKYQKAIRFDVPTTHECVLRRPKIISSKKPKRTTKYDYDDYSYSPCETPKCKSCEKTDFIKPIEKYSHHTLEVYGYDYEDDVVKPVASVEKEILLNQQSFTSDEEFSFDYEPLNNTYRSARDHIDMFDRRGI